ncbi:MAG: hypothetical protein KGZ65_04380 [Sphingomonadales bacterium]|nr:hypothetical protein [Sphingomonadaceae bacterium]MBS3930451.1 hypothetical protein [Sphingomonadales bacterium]
MPTPQKWGTSRWGTFLWGGSNSAALTELLDRKDGLHVHRRIIWELDAADQNITPYFLSASSVYQEKERSPDRVAAGDATLTFSNYNDAFTETDSSSFLYNVNYHNRNVTIEVGLELDDGTIEYVKVATMKVRSITLSSDKSRVTIRIYDLIRRLLTETINRKPEAAVAVAGGSNVGNGTCSDVDVKPFVNVSQTWAVTCTLGGGTGVATFSVVGSVSGNIGTLTDGTEFSNATTGGIKLSIRGGTINWVIGDVFTFSTFKMMEYNVVNPVKILWSLLTGVNWDTGLNEDWKARTPQLDGTLNSANVDLNYGGFASAVDNATFDIKGFVPWDYDLVKVIEEIMMHFLGSINVDSNGRLYVKIWRPELGLVRTFADTKKNRSMSLTRDTQDMINWVNVKYRKADSWPWSNEREEDTLDGVYVAKNQDSYDDFGQWFTLNLETRWYNAAADQASFPATRLVDKYAIPPRRFTFKTGLDGLETQIGDVIGVTDEKLGYTDYQVEVMRKDGDYAARPAAIVFEAEDTGTAGVKWVFLGSTDDEGDDASPQATSFLTATDADKQFCYLSQTGGSGSTGPDYYLFSLLACLLCHARDLVTL